jgi:FtsH-binding integral membrane protein
MEETMFGIREDGIGDSGSKRVTTPTARWLSLARWAAATMVIWSAALQVMAGELIPPVLVVGLIFLGFVPFLTGDRPRLGLALATATLLLIGGNAPFLIDDLSNPESSPTFVLGLLSLVAGLTGMGAGFAAWRGSYPAVMQRIVVGAVSVVIVGAAMSLIVANGTTSDAAVFGDVEIVAAGAQWSEDTIELAPSAGIWIDNEDGIRHTFSIESVGFEFEIPAFKSRRADVDLAPGTYAFVCTVPGHESMTGTLLVQG